MYIRIMSWVVQNSLRILAACNQIVSQFASLLFVPETGI
jgi:hypothetical protein